MFLFYIVRGMFKDDGDLSPDLVWMLQSSQIDVDALIEALVSSYYQQIYTSALSILTYPEEAHRAAQNTLSLVIIHRKDFRGNSSLQHWIEDIASRIIAERKSNLVNFTFLNPKLIKSIRSQQPDNTFSDRTIQLAIKDIKTKVKGSRNSRSNWAYIQLVGLTSIVILVAYLLFNSNNTILTEMPEDLAPSSVETSIRGEIDTPLSLRGKSTPIQEIPDNSFRKEKLPPLSTESSPEQIKDRILSSNQLWGSMWADIVVSFHGPAAYIGPPFTERHQLWIDQVSGDFQVIGPPQGIPDSFEHIISSSESSPLQLGFQETSDYAKLGSIFPWYSIKTETVFLFPFAINYLFNTIEQDFLLKSKLILIGEETIADREAVIIELTSQEGNVLARLWLDTQIGIILKEQYFDPHGTEKVIIESSLRKILFDDITPTRRMRTENSTLSESVIYPGINGATEQSGSSGSDFPMLGFPFRRPKSDFDLEHARISFAKADSNELVSPKIGKYHIFADGYFLGNIEMIDPLKIICDRSSDGTIIVMSNWGIFPTDAKDKIYWLDLKELESFHLSIPNTFVFWTSVSPDNQKIVVSGYDERDGQDRFYLIDVKTGVYELLPIQAGFSSIAWSPDGSEIAILDLSFYPSDFKSSIRIRIFDVQTGDEKRRFISNEIPNNAANLGVILDGWRANFQFPLQDLSHCTSPP
jgi:hypothetical protein